MGWVATNLPNSKLSSTEREAPHEHDENRGPVLEDDIREVLKDHGKLPVDVKKLSFTDDLYRSGLTSHASVNLMLALEDKFEIEFPESMLRKSTFQSIGAIHDAISELTSK